MRSLYFKKFIWGVIFSGIIISNFFVRWNKIDQEPYGFELDELSWTIFSLADSLGVDATSFGVWDLHRQNLINFPVSVKLNQLSFIIFGGDITSPRKFLVILNTAALVFFFLICRYFFSSFTSVLLLVLYSFSSYNLISSRVSLVSSFSNILLFPAIFLFLKSNNNKFINSLLFSFFSGLLTALSLLTYNTLYFFPVIIILYGLLTKKQRLLQKKLSLTLLFFFLPLLFFGNRIYKGLSQQFLTRQYVMKYFPNKSDSFSALKTKVFQSGETVYSELFKNTPPDMLINWPGTLFNKKVSLLAAVGLILILFKPSAFLFLIIWFFFYPVIFHTFLGFNYPRMWITTSALILLLAGVSIEYIYKAVNKPGLNLLKNSILILICITVLLITLQDYQVYKSYAIFNPAFKGRERELTDIIKSEACLESPKDYVLLETDPPRATFDRSILLFGYLSNAGKKPNDQEIKNFVDSNILLIENLPESTLNLTGGKKLLIVNNEDYDSTIKTKIEPELVRNTIIYKYHRLIFLR